MLQFSAAPSLRSGSTSDPGMTAPYEEIIHGESVLRSPRDPRHDEVCARLQELVAAALVDAPNLRLESPRSLLELSPADWLHPDLLIFDTSSNAPWLVAEVIDSVDHTPDTVAKKRLYEAAHIPRVWMIDPRYDNAEVYHDTPYGLSLKGILAGKELLTDTRLPKFRVTVEKLFG